MKALGGIPIPGWLPLNLPRDRLQRLRNRLKFLRRVCTGPGSFHLLFVAMEFLSRLDVRVFRDGLLVLADRSKRRCKHPSGFHVVFPEVYILAGVAAEIEKHWQIRF